MIIGTAKIEYYLFRLFTTEVTVSERMVVYGGFPVKIIEECTGVYEVIIFAAAVLAFPTGWKKKAVGFGLGIPLIYFFNVMRIMVRVHASLFLAGDHDRDDHVGLVAVDRQGRQA
jgi:exosortase/archaeosortase family protein